MGDSSQSENDPLGFATTRWSQVIQAGDLEDDQCSAALASLCSIYWFPLYVYARRKADDGERANDLVQSFFAELLDKNFIAAAQPERGKFRAFLITALRRFMSKQWSADQAQKRGGTIKIFSLDFEQADSRISLEPANNMTAEQEYDRNWALLLLERVLTRLEQEMNENGKLQQFEILKSHVIGEHHGCNYREIASQLQLSESAARMAASRLRHRYRELLRLEIGETVSSADEIDDEIRDLFQAVARKP